MLTVLDAVHAMRATSFLGRFEESPGTLTRVDRPDWLKSPGLLIVELTAEPETLGHGCGRAYPTRCRVAIGRALQALRRDRPIASGPRMPRTVLDSLTDERRDTRDRRDARGRDPHGDVDLLGKND